MGNFKDSFDDFINDVTHLYHFLCGVGVFMVLLISSTMGGSADWAAGLNATVAVFVAMLLLQVKDVQCGTEIDWEDIVAGMIFPAIFWILLAIYHLVLLFS